MKKRIGVLSGILVFVVLIGYIWFTDSLKPVDTTSTKPVMFVVAKGESIRSVANRLEQAGLIRDSLAFFILLRTKRAEKAIQAGDFRLNSSMDAWKIIDELQHGTVDIWVTILEGWRLEEIAVELTKTLSVPETEFMKYAQEGYMFPDTYLFPKEASASAVVAIMKENFSKKVGQDFADRAAKQGMTVDEAVVLASLVEREGRTAEDKPIIAGVLLKRLREDWPLQVDATLQYILGYQSDTKTWWKKYLTNTDKDLSSAYNTYKNLGLPPAPIASPGLISLSAVVNPTDSPYWYYIHDEKGEVHFAETLKQHEDNIARYL